MLSYSHSLSSYVRGVREEMGERLFVIIQVYGSHQVALDDLPCLASVVRLRAAGLEGVQRHLDGLLHR